jgi:SAM-dependent methyltransferase
MSWNEYWNIDNTCKEFKYRNVPDTVILEYISLFESGKVLDLGMGEGRNAFFLARNGFQVDGCDISSIAIERCQKYAKIHNLSINAEVNDITKLDIPKDSYGLIILSMLIYFFRISQIKSLIQKVIHGLKIGGFIYLSAMTTSNPSYSRCKKDYKEIEKNTFYVSNQDVIRHYVDKEEIQNYLNDLEVIYFAEVEKLDIMHDEPHYHNLIEYLGRKVSVVHNTKSFTSHGVGTIDVD